MIEELFTASSLFGQSSLARESQLLMLKRAGELLVDTLDVTEAEGPLVLSTGEKGRERRKEPENRSK
jgi:hypothetical protein